MSATRSRVLGSIAVVVTLGLIATWVSASGQLEDVVAVRDKLALARDEAQLEAGRARSLNVAIADAAQARRTLRGLVEGRTLWSEKLDHLADVLAREGDGVHVTEVKADDRSAEGPEVRLGGWTQERSSESLDSLLKSLETDERFARDLVSVFRAPNERRSAGGWEFSITCTFRPAGPEEVE